jgi:GDSL-like lipase/acylhydrolase family protein
MKSVGSILAATFGLVALAGACTDSRLPTEGPISRDLTPLASESEGRGVFHRYVAIGTSVSMGVQSDGVYWESQTTSWPAQLARLANRELSLPLIEAPGCGAPLKERLSTGVRISGEAAGAPADGRVCAPLQEGITLPAGNVAIDGARTRDALFSTTATYAGTLRGRQYERVLPPGETQVSAMLAQNPKVVSVELGGNEVLGARSGIFLPGVTVELVSVWKPLYTQVLDAVEGTAKHAVIFGMIDDAMEFPGFRTAQELWDARATFAPFNVAISEDCGTINATNVLFVAVRVPDAAARGAASARAGTGPHVLNCFNAPSASGVQDFVLTAGEVALLNAQIAEMDAFIRDEAERRGFAYTRLGALYSEANVKAAFSAITLMTSTQPYGPNISLDGIHPSAAGARILADAAAAALNARYDLGIPLSSASLIALAP